MAMWLIAKDSWEEVAALGLATGGDAATALGLVTGGDAATALGLVTVGDAVTASGLVTGGDAATALGLVTGGDAATALGLVTGGEAATASGLVTVVTMICSTTWLRKQATTPDTVNARASHVSGGGVDDGDWATRDMLLWLTV